MRNLFWVFVACLLNGNVSGADLPQTPPINIANLAIRLSESGQMVGLEHDPALTTDFSGPLVEPKAIISSLEKAGYTVERSKAFLLIHPKDKFPSLAEKLKTTIRVDRQRLDSVIEMINEDGATKLNLAFAPPDVSLKVISVDISDLSIREALSKIASAGGYKCWSTTPIILTGPGSEKLEGNKNAFFLNFQ